MGLLLAGLAGVVLGALIATVVCLHVIQKRADRDLIERRIRACAEYLDCLGDVQRAVDAADGSPEVVDQAWLNARSFCREFRLTGWILPADVRATVGRIVEELERAAISHGTNGSGPAREAQFLCEKYHEVQRLLRSELALEERAFGRFRFFPELGRRG